MRVEVKMRKIFLLLICVALTSSTLSAAGNRRLNVVTTLFPLFDFVQRVGGDRVKATLLLPPGVEAHSFSPRPKDAVAVGSADVFVYTGEAMEPWVGDFLKGLDDDDLLVVDATKGLPLLGSDHDDEHHDHHHHGGVDPHVWLDPSLAGRMVGIIADALAKKDPADAETFKRNAAAYQNELRALDRDIRGALSRCERKTIVCGGHFAFGYFAKRYGLKHRSAYSGFSPSARPSPRALANLIKNVKRDGAKAIYYGELINPKVAKVIAEETGAELLLLHGAHNISANELRSGATYLSIMRENLERLKKGLGYRPDGKTP